MNFRKQGNDGNNGSIMIDWVTFQDATLFEHITRKFFSDKEGKFRFKDSFSFMVALAKAELEKQEALSKCKIQQNSG